MAAHTRCEAHPLLYRHLVLHGLSQAPAAIAVHLQQVLAGPLDGLQTNKASVPDL